MKSKFLKILKRKLKGVSRKTSIKIGVVVSLTMLTLLLLLNIVVIERSRNTFVKVVKTVTVGPVDGGNIVLEREQVKQFNILRFYQDGTERPVPLQEEFVKEFQASLLKISVIGIIVSFIIGFLSSQVYSRPLRALSNGMRQLRNNDYYLKLQNLGSEEFDEVICEFNRLTDQLSKVEKLRKDLISDTSHELKTPLTSLFGQLNGIKEGVLILDKERNEVLISQVERLSDIVNRLQEFSRIQGSQLNLKKKKINLSKLINKITNSFGQEFNNKNIKLVLEVDKSMTVLADNYLLSQVFTNLLQNAVKYSRAEQVTIIGNKNEIVVRDDGIGISDEDKQFIFERFYRVEKSRNRKTGGLGLGLAIVKEIVEAHEWKIKVKDNEPAGTKFVITIK